MDSEARVVLSHSLRHARHGGFERLVPRIKVQPLLQEAMRSQVRELPDDRRLVLMPGANQHAVPLPTARLGRFHHDHHLTSEQVDGQSPEHSLREETGMAVKELKYPFIVESL